MREFNNISKGINTKVNVVARLELELAYLVAAVQPLHYGNAHIS